MSAPATHAVQSALAPGESQPPRCRNCEAPLVGPYCARCGQRDAPPDPTMGELFAEAWDAFVSVDGKVARSVRLLLTRPGGLTTEYLRGHRARFVPPLRLYLACSLVFFLISAVAPQPADEQAERQGVVITGLEGTADTLALTGNRAIARDVARRAARDAQRDAQRDSSRRAALARLGVALPVGALDSSAVVRADSLRYREQFDRAAGRLPAWLRGRLARGVARVSRDGGSFDTDFREQLPRLMFVLMPVFAALLALAYRGRRRRFPAHLVVALHLHAFIFAALALGELRAWVPWAPAQQLAGLALTGWMVAYAPLALRRVYGGRLRWALARSALLAGSYALVGALAFAVLAVALLLSF